MHDNPTPAPRGASYDSSGPAVVIHDLTVNHPAVCSEAARWSTGQRGPAVAADVTVGLALSLFAAQAMAVGSKPLAAAAGNKPARAGLRQRQRPRPAHAGPGAGYQRNLCCPRHRLSFPVAFFGQDAISQKQGRAIWRPVATRPSRRGRCVRQCWSRC